ncbi:MAG: hypothetical protein J2P36_29030 [Ktedonobacteraceae bacterium]|nr:hypothetical protein [Ktedonobacteraceae bacterium]
MSLPEWSGNEEQDKRFLRRFAREALKGVGDPDLGEWEEWSGLAYHLRRRLTREEQELVGEAIDIRRTPEAIERCAEVARFLPAALRGWKE